MGSGILEYTAGWPVCSPDLSPGENAWCITRRETREQGHRAAEIEQEWERISLAKLHQ